MTVGAIPPVPLCLSVWFFTYSFFSFHFLSKKREWNSGYKAVLSSKQQSSWAQFVCSLFHSAVSLETVGLPGSLEAVPSRQSLIRQSLTRLCLGGPCTPCVSRRSCPEMRNTTWVGSCCLEDAGVCGKGEMLQDSWAVSAWHGVGTQGCHDPTQMGSEIPPVLC